MQNSTEAGANRSYRLQSCDGQTFDFTEDMVAQLGVVWRLVDDRMDVDVDVFPLNSFDANSKAMKKVLAWCQRHTGTNKEAMGEDALRKWEEEFVVGLSMDLLYKLLMVANYLEAQELRDRLVDRVVDLIRGKVPEQIRQTFGIIKDSAPDVEAEASDSAVVVSEEERRTSERKKTRRR